MSVTRTVATAAAVAIMSASYAWAGCGACGSGAAGHSAAKVMDHQHDIVETAIEAGLFNTLVAAIQGAELVETLKGDGPFTVFAPTDEAFAKLPEGTVENLMKPENRDQLVAILTYHVVAGKVMASDVVLLSDAKTLQGESFTVSSQNGQVSVDGAKVVKTDIETSNGIIHVIDTVILPGKKS